MVIMVKSAMLDVCSPGLLRDVVAAANVAGGDTRIVLCRVKRRGSPPVYPTGLE